MRRGHTGTDSVPPHKEISYRNVQEIDNWYLLWWTQISEAGFFNRCLSSSRFRQPVSALHRLTRWTLQFTPPGPSRTVAAANSRLHIQYKDLAILEQTGIIKLSEEPPVDSEVNFVHAPEWRRLKCHSGHKLKDESEAAACLSPRERRRAWKYQVSHHTISLYTVLSSRGFVWLDLWRTHLWWSQQVKSPSCVPSYLCTVLNPSGLTLQLLTGPHTSLALMKTYIFRNTYITVERILMFSCVLFCLLISFCQREEVL